MALPETASFENLKTRISENPDITRFLSKQRVDEAELHLARAQRKPSWRVSAGVRRLEISDDEALIANITLPLAQRRPIWHERTQRLTLPAFVMKRCCS